MRHRVEIALAHPISEMASKMFPFQAKMVKILYRSMTDIGAPGGRGGTPLY